MNTVYQPEKVPSCYCLSCPQCQKQPSVETYYDGNSSNANPLGLYWRRLVCQCGHSVQCTTNISEYCLYNFWNYKMLRHQDLLNKKENYERNTNG